MSDMIAYDRNQMLFEQLCVRIQDAWERERDADLVEEFSRQYPNLADELFDFFDYLLATEIVGEQGGMDEHSMSVIRSWYETEGRGMARRLAAEERERLGQTGALETPTVPPKPAASGAELRSSLPPNPETGGPKLSLIGLLREKSQKPIVAIAQDLRITPIFLRLITDHPDVVPTPVKEEVAQRAEASYGLVQGRVLDFLNEHPAYPMAASRDQPYAARSITFEQILTWSDLSEDDKAFWQAVARREHS